jgi:hypothetical protein
LEVHRHFFNRGSKSRNKVAVGEPAAGSFFRSIKYQKNIQKKLIFFTKKTFTFFLACFFLVIFFFIFEINFLLQRNGDTVLFKRGISNILLVLKERRFSFVVFFFHQKKKKKNTKGDSASGTRTEVPKLIFITKIKRMGPYFGMLGCGYQIGDQIIINKKKKKKKKKTQTKKKEKETKKLLFSSKNPHKTKNNFCRPTTVDDGSHNVSRWMTWLPISLKNAAKCDKWYQLQNLSITESLNANGTWKKILVVQLQVCHDLSVEQKPRKKIRFFSGRFCA